MKPEEFNASAKQEKTVTTTTTKLHVGHGLTFMSVLGAVALMADPTMALWCVAMGLGVDYMNDDLPRVATTTTVKALPAPEAKPADPKP